MGYCFDDDEEDAPPNAKLSPEVVKQAREEYRAIQQTIATIERSNTVEAYARRLGVGKSTMERALRGASKAVPETEIKAYKTARTVITTLRKDYSIKAFASRNSVCRDAMWRALAGITWSDV